MRERERERESEWVYVRVCMCVGGLQHHTPSLHLNIKAGKPYFASLLLPLDLRDLAEWAETRVGREGEERSWTWCYRSYYYCFYSLCCYCYYYYYYYSWSCLLVFSLFFLFSPSFLVFLLAVTDFLLSVLIPVSFSFFLCSYCSCLSLLPCLILSFFLLLLFIIILLPVFPCFLVLSTCLCGPDGVVQTKGRAARGLK